MRMTRQLSRERLEEIKEFGFARIIKPISDEEILTLIDIALAGMDSDPVAYIFKHPSGKLFWALTDESNKGRKDVMPVYAAPPAIPDHMTLIEKGRLLMLERSHQTLLDYRADSVWYWQGDEDDQPEILSCPVIMNAETLRELLAKAAPPAPVAVPDVEPYLHGLWPYAAEALMRYSESCRAAMRNAEP